MVRFRLFGIPVEVQPSFWIIMALFGLMRHQGTSSSALLIGIGLFAIAGFVSILVHELGHALTGKAFGAPTQIILHSFGGLAAFPPGLFTRGQNLLVTAAGPAFQVALGIATFMVWRHFAMPSELFGMFILDLAIISVFWAVINLIPVIPLDGGQLMAGLLGPRRIRLSLEISMVSAIVGAILMAVFLQSLFFPIFLGAMAFQNWQQLQHHRR